MVKLNYLESNFNFIFLEVFRRAKHDNESVFEKKSKTVKKSCFSSVILALVLLQGVLLPAIPWARPRPPTPRVSLERIIWVIQLYLAMIQNLHIAHSALHHWDRCCIKDGEEECECTVHFFHNVTIAMSQAFLNFRASASRSCDWERPRLKNPIDLYNGW